MVSMYRTRSRLIIISPFSSFPVFVQSRSMNQLLRTDRRTNFIEGVGHNKGIRICLKPNCFTAADASTKMCSCLDYTVLQPSINPTASTQLLQPNFFIPTASTQLLQPNINPTASTQLLQPNINQTASTKYQPNCSNPTASTQLLQPNINPTASTKYQPNWPCNP